jgi:hypothetical protein
MNVIIEQVALAEAIRIVTRLAPPISGNITVQSDGKKLFLHSSSEVSRCSVNLPAEVSGKATTFAISITALKDATKGRAKLTMLYDKTLCKITSGAYRCELPTVDAIEMDSETEDKSVAVKFSAEQVSWLKGAVAAVALKPTALLASFMPVLLKLTSKGAFVSCFDSTHVAYIQSKEVTGDMEMNLSLETLTAVLDAFHSSAFKLELGKSNLYVANALVKVVLALPQEEDNAISANDLLSMTKSSRDAKGQEFEVAKTDLLAFLDNARAVATKERSEVLMRYEDGKIKLSVSTTNGSTTAVIKASCKKHQEERIDFEFLDEAVRKSGESIVMKLVKDEFISFKLREGTIILSLNQRPK